MLKDLFNDLLAKFFMVFSQFMIKIQPIWDRFKVLILLGIGLIIGWIIGWNTVRWTDAPPSLLRRDYRAVYLAKVAEDHANTGNMEMTVERLGMDEENGSGPWKDKPETLLANIQDAINNAEALGIQDKKPALERFKQDMGALLPALEAAEAPASPGLLTIIIRFLATLLAITLVATAIWYLLVGRKKREAEVGEPAPAEGQPEEALTGGEQPSSVKTYTYVLGDDYFDPSFSIEIGPDFYGECGIGITETIGAGDPKKVTAFETWLFDKSDIRTVTAILGSEFAMTDPDLTEKLQPKREGDELLVLEPGMEIALETTALRINARITELEYAQGNLPANSFFQKVTFELQAWVKQVEQGA